MSTPPAAQAGKHRKDLSEGYYVGLMTGTSMDGIDAALVQFTSGKHDLNLELVATYSHPIPQIIKADLEQLILPGEDTVDCLGSTDAQLGILLGDAVNKLLTNAKIEGEDIVAIGSHGQTIRHRPPGETLTHSYPFSVQIGDPHRIAAQTHITTVADFRRRDLALGGHGAPLVPAFHKALFQHPQAHRVIVNIGGIANITNLPLDGSVKGFDTGPGNTLMDAWSRRHLNQPYDDRGQWASDHHHHPKLLAQLKEHSFFMCKPPKSTGREDFNLSWLEAELRHFEKHQTGSGQDLSPGVVQATLLTLTAETISEAIRETAQTAEEIYICGGGALNLALLASLERLLTPAKVGTTTPLGLDPQWVEAAAFAWLARQTLLGLPGSLAEVTGASKSEILGAIFPAGID